MMERPLLYYAIKLVGNRDVALDVLQEAWIRALRGIRKLKDAGSIRPWLYRIVHGVAVDQVCREKVRERSEEARSEMPVVAEDATFDMEDAAAIHRALDNLEPKHKEVLTLYFLEDFSISEISLVTDCPEGTVKSRLYYAKNAMRQLLTGGTNEPR